MNTIKPSGDSPPLDPSRTTLARHIGLMVTRIVRYRSVPDQKYWRHLARLDQFMRLVLASHIPPYQTFFDGGSGLTTRRARPTFIDEQRTISLADHFPELHDYSYLENPHLTYAPHFELFFELFRGHRMAFCRGTPDSRIGGGLIVADVCNDFADLLRKVAVDRGLSRAMHNWEMNSESNLIRLRGYLDGLFARAVSLTTVHLNVVHTTAYFNLEYSTWAEQEKFLRDLGAARQIFMNRRSNHPALFEHMKGFVWSIETSLMEGFSLHLTLIFDTAGLMHTGNLNGGLDTPLALSHNHADQRRNVTFPQLLGEYIVRVATKGNGRYLVCHQSPSLYPDWPYGVIEASDSARRWQLEEALGNLAMKQDLARLKNLQKGGGASPETPHSSEWGVSTPGVPTS
ncbi:hypothetical protein P9239_06310 [Caballeronia sp. LZ062]|uniref:hypothetical protein n=1 Tax=Caballeronia sp. LZ062 TaxID=3038557 RepID=UPI0028636E6F|nr:hypothetical protein [Caballeronia sp. LZ062]MDR5869970.1 hypothetical protein [Caballeronia sp. LZ062]